jgi:hypothetical protein
MNTTLTMILTFGGGQVTEEANDFLFLDNVVGI